MKKTRKSGIYAIKIGMTSLYIDNIMTPVTVVKLLPMNVLTKKMNYALVCVNGGPKLKKPQSAMLKNFGLDVKNGFIREVGFSNKSTEDNIVVKTECSDFKIGDYIDVTGTTKGHGFQGVMKRHGHKGGRASHGNSLNHRTPGSTGSRQDPGKVMKGKKMPGHMGNEQRTIQNLKIVEIMTDDNVLLIKGSIHGVKKSVVFISEAIKK